MGKEPLFKSYFINEFQPGNQIHEIENTVVYHYTGANSLLSILENRYVRFSDIRYMNDRSETVFFVKRLIEFITENGEQYPFFRDAVNDLLAKNDYGQILDLNTGKVKYKDFPGLKMKPQRTFIFCTCNEPDSLNMWNYYASIDGSFFPVFRGVFGGCLMALFPLSPQILHLCEPS